MRPPFHMIIALAGLCLPAAAHAGDPAKGAKVFKECAACHMIGPGAKTRVGPELNGVVGSQAGAVPGFACSPAMKESGLTFDVATLTDYLLSPKALVPGTRMAFAGLPKDEDIADVIAYLQGFGPDGEAAAPPAQ